MNARLSKHLRERAGNHALGELQAQFAHHQMKRAGDHAALGIFWAVRGFLFLALALLALWAEPDPAAWLAGEAPVAAAASCPGRP